MEPVKVDFKLRTQDQAFWDSMIRLEKEMIKGIEEDMKHAPKMLEFHKSCLEFCEKKLKELK